MNLTQIQSFHDWSTILSLSSSRSDPALLLENMMYTILLLYVINSTSFIEMMDSDCLLREETTGFNKVCMLFS
jgi:hypothetical protein